jgi:hypothetical protein
MLAALGNGVCAGNDKHASPAAVGLFTMIEAGQAASQSR